mmetsp:Transcript_21044/g.45579  ORF Transcript_21044/g.45579 Transcript_21044/m.45579 type:complete len:642 (-) Transcript_21044:194-2119(-)|eukprot:CAMPEP_0206428236 /NCGR_PEP_ID=MMETSP0324_2-20121206/5530_1 /ASSEMBLY_ACC=CAM_ASM_000836 /TAXON_ID=2866 /ORGANISM="Crypthecodinium cohnii, Strain Seligo" /LENGTH=641 /DNA_ID=CAMNT_0053893697 /DNA_START=234 /DNA_END=2159 /DNA_ORIENTATION=+
MPNVATHPPRSPGRKAEIKVPIESSRGEIPFTTLEIAHTWNRDVLYHTDYQPNFLAFQPLPTDTAGKLAKNIADEVIPGRKREKEEVTLDYLRKLRSMYSDMVEGRGRRDVPTALLRQLMASIDKVYAQLVKKAVKSSDKDILRELIDFADQDALVKQMIKKSTKLDELKELLPKVAADHNMRIRDQLDEGGVRRMSSQKRASNASLLMALKKEKTDGWKHITFNPETGRLNLLTELAFQKTPDLYTKSKPSAEWMEPDLAKEVLSEVVKVWEIFKFDLDVVQVHKTPPPVEGVNASEHEEWLITLAKSRAKKLKEELGNLGIPRENMSAKVEKVDGSAVMQYCQFSMKWQHIRFSSQHMIVTTKKDVAWEKRLYSYERHDAPEATFADPELAKGVCKEVITISKYYNCDVEVVIHNTQTKKAVDDEHKYWINDLFENRAEKFKDELVDSGLEDSKADCAVINEEELQALEYDIPKDGSAGCHFVLHTEDRSDSAANGQSGDDRGLPDHQVEVTGAGPFEFNGIYRPAGMLNDKPKYRHEKGGKPTICFHKDGFWYLCFNHNIKQSFYKSRDLDGPEPYKHTITDNSGLIPMVKVLQGGRSSSNSLKSAKSFTPGQSALSKGPSMLRQGSRNSVSFNLDHD